MPYSPPETQNLDSILPSEPLLLMGAGPVPISHAVARANGVVINHLGETMDEVIRNVKIMGRYAFQTVSEKIIGVSGPASAAMEMAITNLLLSLYTHLRAHETREDLVCRLLLEKKTYTHLRFT